MSTRRVLLRGSLGAGLVGLGLAGCAKDADLARSGPDVPHPTREPSEVEGDATPTARPTQSQWLVKAAELSVEDRIGQLIMVGTMSTVLSDQVRAAFTEHKVGSLLLLGDSLGGRSDVSLLTSELSSLGAVVPIMVAVDQEGGRIQRLSGDGFSVIPSAVEQAKLPATELQEKWKQWAGELARAGVRFNLAPVADVVPADKEASNAPVGQLQRQYGRDVAEVTPALLSAIKGMAAAKVATSAKHFPGLGRVSTNTDFGEAVDEVTTKDDPGIEAFRVAMDAGVSSIMISSAIYRRIDPQNQGTFSSTIINGLVRRKLGFQKVVISDDLGAAQSVQHIPAGERATRFLQAGGDLVINADPSLTEAMVGAVRKLEKSDPDFAQQVVRKAARVLELKASVA